MSNYKFKDSPIQLITLDSDGLFEITLEGSNFLNSIKKKKNFNC